MDPIEADLTEFSKQGTPSPLTCLVLIFGSGIVFLLIGIGYLVVHSTLASAPIGAFILFIGGSNVALGYYGGKVTKPAGAVWLRVDDLGVRLRFRDESLEWQDWANVPHPFEIRWSVRPEGGPFKPYGQLRLYWSPRTNMPVALARQLVEQARAHGLQIATTPGKDDSSQPIVRNVIRRPA